MTESDPVAAFRETILEQLGSAPEHVAVAAGEAVFREGDAADAMYFIVSGRLAVTIARQGRRQIQVAELGPGEHLFSTQHTLRHYQTAYYDSELDDTQPWETWDEQGGIDMATRASTRWKKLLDDYDAPPLDEGIDAALRDFMDRRKSQMPDMWY